MENRLDGKVALVTGSSRGIGRAIAEQLADLGAKVVINYSGSSQKAYEAVEGIKKNGGDAVAIQADISQVSQIINLFEETLQAFGKINILVNNAGLMINKPLSEATEEDFDKQFAVNAKGTFFACQQALKNMETEGRIVNISTSVIGQMFPSYSMYAGTKGAVEQFTRHLAKEFGPKGITINAIAPGPVNTELFNVGKSEQQIEGMKKMNAFGRLGETDDIANVVSFLVSEQAQWVTGQTIRVNGGFI
ncbi:SDR family oxidoreductase [Peribacillus castrilensis]|uniref:3-oxoacyl-ACP reductase n=1 Tax=Peribacillus simplex TaxID=1478 RepID=A0AAN2TV52_9BACI|nr:MULTISPECIES: SDR family oxidoreductase [Bacillaceae]MCP1094962.1 SDR family oxidoreductase [Bacillaceae bacterium OS4b]MBD8587573.1 SDR family oxidoreductase [Peribacillus simplex]MCF7624798.1 SDR family oxidoreductase [Peribacillus frigoritolerans]MCP1155315.1 SDR family oxidoreductase [Peribacillus frigoritolerans]MCT1389724.1 SDR family oxidoreductase [Peribacillus frigoritolerans]